MSNSSSKGTALITGASRGIGAVCAHPVEALDYDFNLSKLERVMPKPWPCPGARLLSGFI
jgi:hypothetical protein